MQLIGEGEAYVKALQLHSMLWNSVHDIVVMDAVEAHSCVDSSEIH